MLRYPWGGKFRSRRQQCDQQTWFAMAHGKVHYTLIGFSAELDWRPQRFVKPIPPNRVCGACRLVRKRTVLLPCSHTLCESCYKLCAQGGAPVCPLDGEHCEEDDVDWRDITADELLRRKVTETGRKREDCFYIAFGQRSWLSSEGNQCSLACPMCNNQGENGCQVRAETI